MAAQSIGSAIFHFRGDDSQLRSILGRIPSQIREQGAASERVAAAAFGQAGAVAGRTFGAGIGSAANGIPQSFAAIGTAAGNNFADNIRSGTAGVARSIAAPLAGIPDIIGANGLNAGRLFTSGLLSSADSIGSRITNPLGVLQGVFSSIGANSGRAFSTGVLGGTAGLPGSIAQPMGVLPSSFASVGGQSGRSFASAVASGLGSIVSAAQSAAGRMATPFLNAGRQIGANIRGDIGRGINYSIANRITGAAGAAAGSLFDTKNFGEADAEYRRTASLSPKEGKSLARDAQSISKKLGYGAKSTDISKGQYEVLSSNFVKREDVNALVEAGVKLSMAGGGRAATEDTIKATTRLANILRNNGVDGSGKQKLDVARDAGKLANIISGFQDASTGYSEKMTASSIGKLLQPATALKINTYDALAVAAVASNTLGPERVNSGIPGVFKNIQKPTKQAIDQANDLKFDFSAQALQNKGIIPFLDELNVKLKEYQKINGEASKTVALSKLFGGIQPGSVVGAVIDNTGLIKESSSVIQKASVDDKTAIVQQGLIAKQTAFKNSLVELDVQIKSGLVGTVLTDAFKGATVAVAGLASGLEKLGQWYSGLDSGTQSVIRGIGTVGAVAVAAAVGITGVGIAVGLIGPPLVAGAALLGGFATGLGSIALAAVPIAIPILAASAAVYGLAKAFGATDGQAFTAALVTAGAGLALLFGPAVIASAVAGTSTIIAGISSIAVAAIGMLATAVPALVTGFGSIAIAATAAIIPLAPFIAAAALVAGGLYLLYEALNTEAFQKWDTETSAIVDNWVSANITGFQKWDTETSAIVDNWVSANITGLQKWGSETISFFGDLWNSIVASIFNFGASTGAFLSGWTGKVGSLFSKMSSDISGSIDKWLQSIGLVPKGVSVTGDAVIGLKNTIGTAFTGSLVFFDNLKNGAIKAFDSIGAKIKEMLGFIGDIPKKIQEAANSLNVFSGNQPAAKTGSSGKGSSIVATGYTPGEGDTKVEGGYVGYKSNRITKEMPVIATRTGGTPKGIPYGAEVQISDPSTGKSTTAKAVDRGPLQPGVDVDLTTRVFKNLGIAVDAKGMPKQGKVALEIKVLSVPGGKVADKYDLGTSGGGYYNKKGDYVGNYGKEIGGGGDFLSGIGNAIGNGLKGIQNFFGGGGTVASPVPTKSIAQATKDVIPGLGNFGAPRPGRIHEGADFNGAAGTPVVAPYAGIAEYVNLGRTGSAVIIKSIDGAIKTRMLHLTDESRRFFANGPRQVRAGEQVGDIGTFGAKYRDGTKTGSEEHVHIEMRINGKLEDPVKVLKLMERSTTIAKSAPKVAVTKSNQPFASSRKVENTTERLKTIEQNLTEQQLLVNPNKGKIAKLIEQKIAAKKKLDRATQDQTKKRVNDQYKQSDKATKAEIREVELQAKLIDSEEKNQLSKATEQGAIGKIKANAAQRRQALAPVIAKLKEKYANNPAFIIKLNKVDTGLVEKSETVRAQSKPKLITAPKIGEAGSVSQRKVDESASSLNEATTKLSDLKSQTNPASKKELLAAENLVKKRTRLFDYAVIDAGKKREKDRAKNIKDSAEAEVDSVQAQLSVIASTARLATSRVDRSTDKGKAEIVRIEANRVGKEKALIPKVTALRAKNSGNSKLAQRLDDIETNINENATPKVSKDKLTDVGILEQQVKTVSSGVAKKNQLTDLAIIRGQVTKEAGASVKAERGTDEAKQLAALLPKVAGLRQKYLKNPEVTAQIDALESRIVEKQSDSVTSNKAASGAKIETIKAKIDGTIRDRDRANNAVENNVSMGSSRESGDQAILSNKIRYNDELQKSVPLLKAFKAAASSREDIRAAEDSLDLLAKNNAETISAQKGDNLATVKLSIDKQLTNQSNRSEDINNSLLNGEIDQIEAQRQQLANRQIYNEELQKTLQTLEYIRSISKGDAIVQVDTEIRRVNKNDAETKSAKKEFQKIEVTEQLTKIDRIIKTGEQRQSIAKDDAILNKPERNNTSFLDPNIAIEKQHATTMLTIRQQTAKQLAEEIELLKQKRTLIDDPIEIERINEKIALARQYQIDIKIATDAQKEADRASTVAAQTTKQLNEQLGTSFRDMFTDVFRGAKSLGSIFDNLLNKIADIGINAIFNQVFGNISGSGSSGGVFDGLLGIAGKIFGFSNGGAVATAAGSTLKVGNYANGGSVAQAFGVVNALNAAMQREGAGAVPIVANDREYVLNPRDTEIFKRLSASGEWARISQVSNYSSGGAVGSGVQAMSNRSAASSNQQNNMSVTVDRINSVDYVSLDQVQAMFSVQMPLAVNAAVAGSTQNLSNTSFRQANGIR